jgi:hypothetical protein
MIRKYPCVLIVTHANGHNDGGEAILDHLSSKYDLVYRDGKPTVLTPISAMIDAARDRKSARTLVLEAPYPYDAAAVASVARIAPQDVTHVLLIVDANTIDFDPSGTHLRNVARLNGATGIGLGNVGSFDPISLGAETFHDLSGRAQALIGYVEQFLALPVPFVATSSATVIDREPFKMHEEPDPTRAVRSGKGAPDA